MSVNLRFPNITAGTEAQQITQIRSFLHQLVEQLNWVLSNQETGNVTQAQTQSTSLSTSEYEELRALIILTSREIDTKLSQYVTSNALEDYAKSEDLASLTKELNALANTVAQLIPCQAVDYVTEEGSMETEYGTWRFEKRKSGKCRMEGSFSVTPAGSELGTALYRTEIFVIPLPLPLEKAVVTATARVGFVENEGVIVDENTRECLISFQLVSDAEFPANTAIEVSLSVAGNYITKKTGGDTNGESQ